MNLKLPKISVSGIINIDTKDPNNSFLVQECFFWLMTSALGCDSSITGITGDFIANNSKSITMIQKLGYFLCKRPYGYELFGEPCLSASINADETKDLLPMIAVLCASTSIEAEFEFSKAGMYDFMSSINTMMISLGINTALLANKLLIKTDSVISGGVVDTIDDARLVFGCALASIVSSQDIMVMNINSFERLHPRFWNKLNSSSAFRFG
ncbi:MAG: hypothetical protein FWG10_09925 [Eubacteriaceae bacterium]|nr:hypothetical protein [Eubacteriaceae bacterium]